MPTPTTPQAVLAFLKKKGFPVARITPDARTSKGGVRVRLLSKDLGTVSVTVIFPFEPSKSESEFKRVREALVQSFTIDSENEHLVIVSGK